MESILSRFVHAKNNAGISYGEFLIIANDALLNFGERCLVSYAKNYEKDPKAFISSFIKFDSIKMACEYSIKWARINGIEYKKDFSEWVNKQNLEEKWKPVLSKFLSILYVVLNKEQEDERSVAREDAQ